MAKDKRKTNESDDVEMETYEDAEEIMKVVREITEERSGGGLPPAGSSFPGFEAIYRGALEWLKGQEYVSLCKIQRECAVGFIKSRRILSRFQEEGRVGKEPTEDKGYKVIG